MKPRKPLGSIKDELAACLAAFKKYPKAKQAWCCHHSKLFEGLKKYELRTGRDWLGRINYIQHNKPWREQARRFRNFRPVKPKSLRLRPASFYSKARERQEALFKRQWPDNTWNGNDIGL
jgi:hypothetical protein